MRIFRQLHRFSGPWSAKYGLDTGHFEARLGSLQPYLPDLPCVCGSTESAPRAPARCTRGGNNEIQKIDRHTEHNTGAARLIVNPRVLRCFLRWPLTEVPSLHRSYPASSVVRTSPPPQTAPAGLS